jgi:phosphoadenosine phosphosulfate reductase
MLIPSHRHSRRDLDLWRELEDADRVHGERLTRSGKIEESLGAIRAFVAKGRAYGGISWGKDSVVLAHLLRIAAPDIPLVHLRPTNANPDCDLVRDAYFAGWPGQSYEEVPVDYGSLHASGLPDHELDRKTDARWYAAIRASETPHGGRRILGIRNGEGFGRLIRTLRWGIATERACAPLAWWTMADVYGYLAIHGLPVHPAYACLGGGRWPRERLRVAEIGDTHGKGSGRRDWESEYYGDVLRRLEVGGIQ